MDRSTLLPALNMFTLLAVLAVLLIGFAVYWHKRSNRAPKDGGPPTEDGSI